MLNVMCTLAMAVAGGLLFERKEKTLKVPTRDQSSNRTANRLNVHGRKTTLAKELEVKDGHNFTK